MYFKQFYLGCLAHASYMIGSDGKAVVVDPQRDVEPYLEAARDAGFQIRHVIETHLHADFVSGHMELAERTGAEIIFGKRCEAAFPFRGVGDGDEVALGDVTLRFLETPGHTPESISILIVDASVGPEPQKVLTGDTLFIGDVGRPDLFGSKSYSAEQMAGMLYDSLHEKLLRLDDAIEVYPAHGAGSLCGRNISRDTSTTIGDQRRFNYALKPMPREDFVRIMTAELPEAPSYFPRDAELNRRGALPLGELEKPAALEPDAIDVDKDLVLDVRPTLAFGTGHVPGAINIGLGGQFASWAGSLLPPDKRIVVVADNVEEVDQAVLRLARVGIEHVRGYLSGGMYAWDLANRDVATLEQIPVDELESRMREADAFQLLDVRQATEFRDGHVPVARNIPLRELEARLDELDPQHAVAVMCKSGYRSSAASSILATHGFKRVTNVVGGADAWIASGYDVEKETV